MENLTEKFGFKMDLGLLKEGEEPAHLKKARLEKQKAKKGEDSAEDEKSEESEEKEEKNSEKDGDLKSPDKADLDKDGKLSSYEKKRGKAIEKNMKESRIMKIIKNEIRKQLKERK